MARPDNVSIEALIDLWQETTRWCRDQLGETSAAAVAWQPFARGHSIGAILLHLAERESYWIEEVLAGRPRSDEERTQLMVGINQPNGCGWAAPNPWSQQEFYDLQDFIRARSLRTLKAFGDSNATVSHEGAALSVWQVVTRLMAHEAYHAGQAQLHKLHYGWGGVEPE